MRAGVRPFMSTGHCFHCGLANIGPQQFSAKVGGELREFCCPACRSVATLIDSGGLSAFYQHHQPSQLRAELATAANEFSAFDDKEWQAGFVYHEVENGQQIATASLLVTDIHCAACVWLLERYLLKIPAVERVHVSLVEQKVSVSWNDEQLNLSAICSSLAAIAYHPEPHTPEQALESQCRENHLALRRLGVAGIAMMQVGMFAIALYAGALQDMQEQYRDLMRWSSMLVATPVVFYSARPFFSAAWRGLKLGRPGMDLPVAVAIGLAYLASCKATILGVGEVYFDSVAMFTFLLLTGRYLEMRARHYAGRMSGELRSLLPSTAWRIDPQEGLQLQPLMRLRAGDELLVKAGAVIPADGEVLKGLSSVNESQLTGEFQAVTKSPGSLLAAGSVNGNSPLEMRVHALGGDCQLHIIERLVARGASSSAPRLQLADKLASVFIVTVLVIAALTYWSWLQIDAAKALWVALSVLVVSCPCALSLATPTALTAATNGLRRRGLLVNKKESWGLLSTITDVVCDKTGTLTRGELSLKQLISLRAGEDELKLLLIARTLESISEHPLAMAFECAIPDKALMHLENYSLHIGNGIEGQVDGVSYRLGAASFSQQCYAEKGLKSLVQPQGDGQWVLLSDSHGPCCWFQFDDCLRDDAVEFREAMRARGLRLHMLSGDSSGSAEQLAESLNFDYCQAGASPEDKLDYIQALQEQGRRVLMLGDGINDVPVLAAAELSVAVGKTSCLAKTHADCILLNGHLLAISDLLAMGERCDAVIRQNLCWSIFYNSAALILAVQGLVPPYLAALGMSFSSLVVVLNALRLQRRSKPAFHVKQPPGPQLSTAATVGGVNG